MAWKPRERVLVPVDFSEGSIQAVDVALGFVPNSAHLYIIHVARPMSPVEPAAVWDEHGEENRLLNLENSLSEIFSDPRFKELRVRVKTGNPGAEIVRYAERIEADLVVMPSKGRTGMRRLTLGSVADRVLRYAPCPVLLLRE
jgi:nucleotide-binding universal stress UspA family protein